MAKDYSKFSKEELIKYIEELQKQLKSTKYGLYWDKSIQQEKKLRNIITNIPILKRVEILNDGVINNILIEGDNIESLISLNMMKSNGFVDIIYIDPPYNTGHEDFKYNDKFINDEDGYRHSKWLSFMEKRLILAKELLNENGIIFISIDDHEQANLKLLCDSIFGEKNFVMMFPRLTVKVGKTQTVYTTSNLDWLICYAKNYSLGSFVKKKVEGDTSFKFQDEYIDIRGMYHTKQALDTKSLGYIASLDYPIIYNNVTYYPGSTKKNNGYRWTWSKEKFEFALKNGFVEFKNGRVWPKKYLYASIEKNDKKGYYIKYEERKKNYSQLEFLENVHSNTNGTEELKKMGLNFPYAKPVSLIKLCTKLITNKNAIVLDFFAGSGTTGQAVLELNKEDGGNRRFILCTNNENNICTDVTYPRLKTVITGIRPDGTKYSDGIPANLIYYKTDFIKDSNNTDQAKYCLVEKVDELICISEDIFIQLERNDYSSHYVSNDETRHMFIYSDYYNEEKFKEFKQRVLDVKGTKVVYVFSSDNNVDETLFEGIKDVEVKPIPSKIYEIYKEIVEDIKRGE